VRALKRLMSFLGVAVGAYAAFAAIVYFSQRKLVFPAPKAADEPVMDDAEVTRVKAPNGHTVYALFVPPPRGAVTIVHFHGNAEELADLVPMAWAFRRAGLGFFAVEYPGYGLAREYAPSEEALYADSEAALWHLQNGLEVPVSHVVLEGQSLGSGVAVEMAKRGHGARLVLISPFTSVPDVAASTIPILPVRWLVRDRFDNLSKARELTLPVLVVHGTDDEVIPVSMGEKLARAFPNAVFHGVRGGHHNDIFVLDGRSIVDRIAEFAKGEFGAH
jgi:hypothetical protein